MIAKAAATVVLRRNAPEGYAETAQVPVVIKSFLVVVRVGEAVRILKMCAPCHVRETPAVGAVTVDGAFAQSLMQKVVVATAVAADWVDS